MIDQPYEPATLDDIGFRLTVFEARKELQLLTASGPATYEEFAAPWRKVLLRESVLPLIERGRALIQRAMEQDKGFIAMVIAAALADLIDPTTNAPTAGPQ